MLSNDGYFVIAHDRPMLMGAGVLCFLAALVSTALAGHARPASARRRAAWLAGAAVTAGTGLWATHFFAMLGFITGLRSGFDRAAMAAALVLAVAVSGTGLALMAGRRPWRTLAGGLVVGLGIVAVDACAMAAYAVAGSIERDGRLVGLAVALALGLSTAAALVLRGDGPVRRLGAALLFAGAVCGHDFVALAALSIGMDPFALVPPGALSPDDLVGPVALAAALILAGAGAALAADLAERRRALAEMRRMTTLADAAVEGLLICDGAAIVAANRSVSCLSGVPAAELAGFPLDRLLPGVALPECDGQPVETRLVTRSGEAVPVELVASLVSFAGREHRAFAVRDLRARKHAEASIHFLAHHDGLTGLPNRAQFDRRLDEVLAAARRGAGLVGGPAETGAVGSGLRPSRSAHGSDAPVSGRTLAVLCLDLDRFKEINDLFGHGAGDEALRAVARVLSATLGAGQLAARLGGDEFGVILPGVGRDEAGALARAVLGALARLDAGRASGPALGTSIGVALFPADGETREQLVTAADTALYRAKAEGRGAFRFYESRMGVEVRDRRRIEHDLRSAVGRGEFELVYQPQMATGTGMTVGFEALLRWRHPSRGYVSPAVFVPIAEESGAILSIGEWVLRTACVEAVTWAAPLRIAVNVSAVQLHAPGFADTVEDVLRDTGIDPRRLELEITETALIRDIARALAALRRLKALGVKVAMDDFGTGYSSLSNLRAFPFDRIKIDGSFVQSVDSNPQAAAIVRAILELGRGLDLSILAEGVETAAELGFLGAESCHEVQGYLLGRPAPIGAFEAVTRGDQAAATEADAAA